MAALSGDKTLAELSAEFGVHPTMISNWKQELVKRAGELFGRGSKAPAGRGRAEGDRRSAPQDRTTAGRLRFSCRAARHLSIAERRAMIAPGAGLSVSRQCALLAVVHSSFYYRPRPERAEELEVLERFDRIFTDIRSTAAAGCSGAVARGDFGWPSARPAADAEARAVGGPAEAEHQQAASRAPGLSVPSARQNDRPAEPSVGR